MFWGDFFLQMIEMPVKTIITVQLLTGNKIKVLSWQNIQMINLPSVPAIGKAIHMARYVQMTEMTVETIIKIQKLPGKACRNNDYNANSQETRYHVYSLAEHKQHQFPRFFCFQEG
jgi:hypothetical protein